MKRFTLLSMLVALFSVTAFAQKTVIPPLGLITEDYTMTAYYFDSMSEGDDVSRTIKLGISGSDVYIQGLSFFVEDAWVKGTLNASKTQISIESPQYYGAINSGGTDYPVYFIYCSYSQSSQLYPTEFVLGYNAATGAISLPTASYTLFLEGTKGVNAFSCYGYSMIVGFEKGGAEEPVAAPEGLVTETYEFKATAVEPEENPADEVAEPYSLQVEVGFDGDDAYIQGLCGYEPELWVKASKNKSGNYVIPANQYMGYTLSASTKYPFYYTAVDANDNLVDIELDFNAQKSQFTTSQKLALNFSKTKLDPYITFTDVTITKVQEVAATPVNPTMEDVGYYKDYPYIDFALPAVGTNGETLLGSKLFYTIWIEKNGQQKPYTFTATAYSTDFDKDVTEVPVTYSGYDFNSFGNGEYRVYFEEENAEFDSWTRVGVQSIYYGGNETHKSEIVWLAAETGISDIKADVKNGKAVIVNLAGQRLNAPQKGLNIINGRKVMMK